MRFWMISILGIMRHQEEEVLSKITSKNWHCQAWKPRNHHLTEHILTFLCCLRVFCSSFTFVFFPFLCSDSGINLQPVVTSRRGRACCCGEKPLLSRSLRPYPAPCFSNGFSWKWERVADVTSEIKRLTKADVGAKSGRNRHESEWK